MYSMHILSLLQMLATNTSDIANWFMHATVTVYRIASFCREDFNLTIGLIRNIKIHDHFICDILYLMLY